MTRENKNGREVHKTIQSDLRQRETNMENSETDRRVDEEPSMEQHCVRICSNCGKQIKSENIRWTNLWVPTRIMSSRPCCSDACCKEYCEAKTLGSTINTTVRLDTTEEGSHQSGEEFGKYNETREDIKREYGSSKYGSGKIDKNYQTMNETGKNDDKESPTLEIDTHLSRDQQTCTCFMYTLPGPRCDQKMYHFPDKRWP